MKRSNTHTAQQLVRSGQYLAAAAILERLPVTLLRFDSMDAALLADVLQRVGRNREAEDIAVRHLRRLSTASNFFAYYHFVLGNIHRDRGNSQEAIEHLQTAVHASHDDDIRAWSHLRLLAAIAENRGSQVATSRLDEVRHSLTRSGDPRPFAALHLWLVETESIQGRLASAWRNLRIADRLLTTIDDLWLRGYQAVNSSVLHYYSANTDEAQRWLQIAIQCGRRSGHRTTLRAAHANLGFLELTHGQFGAAEEAFNEALKYCEPGSNHEIAILDNLADTKLERGDLDGCKEILNTLERRSREAIDVRGKHYSVWGLQTQIRLLLRQGDLCGAKNVAREIWPVDVAPQHSRITHESRLVVAEALLNDEVDSAVNCLSGVFHPAVRLAPDLFAETERVIGRTLNAAGAFQAAQPHFERAFRTFELIGHSTGEHRTREELATVIEPAEKCDHWVVSKTVDHIRALFDLRAYPELFAREAMVLLRELSCAHACSIEQSCDENESSALPPASISEATLSRSRMCIHLTSDNTRPLVLTLTPLPDTNSQLTSLSFRRVIHNILTLDSADSHQSDKEVVWPTNGGPAGQGHGFVFAADSMLSLLRTVRQVAVSDVCVLITGETGTGKEVIAQTIHQYSHRAARPILTLNCAAVPRDLLESQMFGHRKGSFSGAVDNYQGIARAANGGTLFLDEIGEIPFDMQAKLLRFLELNEVHTIGEPLPTKVDVRLVFATNEDLEHAVASNRFRRDLFYRMNVIPIRVPPLRERREEIPILANFFAQRFASKLAKEPVQFSTTAMQLLIFHPWPGNVRQLSNEVRRLATLSNSGAYINPDDLSQEFRGQRPVSHKPASEPGSHITVPIDQPLDRATEQLESAMIKHALRQSRGHVGTAASALGLSRKGLYLKRLRLGLENFNPETSSS